MGAVRYCCNLVDDFWSCRPVSLDELLQDVRGCFRLYERLSILQASVCM